MPPENREKDGCNAGTDMETIRNNLKRSPPPPNRLKRRDLDFNSNNDISFGANLLLGEDPIVYQTGIRAMALNKEYSEEDLLSNTAYIFILLVFTTVVLGAIAFGIREYYLSFQRKLTSATSEKLRSVDWNNAAVTGNPHEILPQEHKGEIHINNKTLTKEKTLYEFSNRLDEKVDGEEGDPSGNRYDVEDQGNKSLEPQMPLGSIYSQFREEEIIDEVMIEDKSSMSGSFEQKQPPIVQTIKIFHDELSSPDFSEGSITRFLNSEIKDFEGLRKYKGGIKYNYKQLFEIRDKIVSELFSILESEDGDKPYIRMSSILKYSHPFPLNSFSSVLSANKEIVDTRTEWIGTHNETVDKTTRCLGIVKLLSVGASYQLFDNPNYFIPSFNEFIEIIIDSNSLFNLLKDVSSTGQSLLIEMILIYCWNHYTFKKVTDLSLKQQFDMWKLAEPIIQPRHNIFRYICNILLGLGAINWIPNSSRMELELKAFVLLRESVKGSFCNEYLSMIPMIAQAVDITKVSDTKYLFYELLSLILHKHLKCCMHDYLYERDIDLKALIQHGFWQNHEHKVSTKTQEISQYLSNNNFTMVEVWKQEVEHGKIYVPSAVIRVGPGTAIIPLETAAIDSSKFITAYPRPVTPGAWNIIREQNQNQDKINETILGGGDVGNRGRAISSLSFNNHRNYSYYAQI